MDFWRLRPWWLCRETLKTILVSWNESMALTHEKTDVFRAGATLLSFGWLVSLRLEMTLSVDQKVRWLLTTRTSAWKCHGIQDSLSFEDLVLETMKTSSCLVETCLSACRDYGVSWENWSSMSLRRPCLWRLSCLVSQDISFLWCLDRIWLCRVWHHPDLPWNCWCPF